MVNVGGLAGKKDVGLNGRGIDLQELLDRPSGLRRIVILERSGRTKQRGRISWIQLEDTFVRLQRFVESVFVEKQVSECRRDRGIVWRRSRRFQERTLRVADAVEGGKRARGARHLDRVLSRRGQRGNALQRLRRREPPQQLLQYAQLQGRLARRR